MTNKLYLIKIIINIINCGEAFRILAVYPTPSISHHLVFRPLTAEFIKRGHRVTLITADPEFPNGLAPENLIEIDIHDVSYKCWTDNFLKHAECGGSGGIVEQSKIGFNAFLVLSEKTLSCLKVQDLIRDEDKKFDVIILEAFARTSLIFAHIYKVPVILISSFNVIGAYQTIGAPVHPVYFPSMYPHNVHDLCLNDQVHAMFTDLVMQYLMDSNEKLENDVVKRIVPDFSSIRKTRNSVNILAANVHPIWEGNRPVPPGVVYFGGMHLRPEKELSKELKDFLDASINGVIYVSFGTNVNPSELPPAKLKIFMKVFSQLRYDILWKWDKDEIPGKPNNIRIFKWLPQSDLLRHPKIKLFITQAGLQSTDEAIAAGVPLIGIPMLFDQWCNAEKYVYYKIGLKIELSTLSKEELNNSIHSVVEDESYRSNVARLRSLMYDQPQRPLERAVWWTEHVLRHGGAKHLRAPAANMGWTEYLELELVCMMLLILFIITYLSFRVLSWSFSYVLTRLSFIFK